VGLYLLLTDVQIARSSLEEARQTLERAETVARNDASLRITIHLRKAEIEDRLGNRNQAEWEREQARRLRAP
jgi:Flp pilus assembly protein TadD